MPPLVIQDSDDEGSEISPVNSPARPSAANASASAPADASVPSRSRSTDLSFFQRVYDEQSRDLDVTIPQTARTEPGPGNTTGHIDAQDQSRSSITDPSASRAGDGRATDPKQLVGLTQVTTPGRPSREAEPSIDIWDFPGSPEAVAPIGTAVRRSARKPAIKSAERKTYGKRKRTTPQSIGFVGLVSPTQEDALRLPVVEALTPTPPIVKKARKTAMTYSVAPTTMEMLAAVTAATTTTTMARFASTTASARRRTRGVSSSPRQDESDTVDLITIPQSEGATRASYGTAIGGFQPGALFSETRVADTQKGGKLEVNLSHALSSSEKQAYKIYSLSSEPTPADEGDGGFLELPMLHQRNSKSSGTTVAMGTPSVFGSPPRSSPINSELPSTAIPVPPSSSIVTKGKKRKPAPSPTSSPDVLTTSVAPSAKKRKRITAEKDDDLAPTQVGNHNVHSPRSSRLRSSAVETLPDTEPPGGYHLPRLDAADNDPVVPEAAPQVSLSETGYNADPILILSQEAPASPVPAEKPVVKSQKKRGRKKKMAAILEAVPEPPVVEETVPAPREESIAERETSEVVDSAPEISVPAVKPKRKRGRQKKSEANVAAVEAGPAVEPARSNSSSDPAAVVTTVSQPLIEVSDTNPKTSDKKQKKGLAPPSDGISASTRGADLMNEDEGEDKKVVGGGKENDETFVPRVIDEDKSAKTEEKPALANKPANGCNAGTTQTGKVSYRVGLSRRSRIAPLLKSLRK